MAEKTIISSSQKNMDLIREWVDAVNRNDVEAELACWQPDGEFYAVPTGMTYKGIEEIRKAGEKSASVVGGQPVKGRKQITHLSAGEDWACVEYDTHADIVGPIAIKDLTLLPEGAKKTVITKACVVFQLKDGKIYRAQEYFDALSMAQQLGLHPEILAKMYASLGSKSNQNNNGSTSRTPIETVKQFFEAWNKKDLNGLVSLLD